MAFPIVIPTILGLLGGGVADASLNEGRIISWLTEKFGAAAADVGGAASKPALEGIFKGLTTDDELAKEMAEFAADGDFNKVFDLITDNLSKFDYAGMTGFLAGGFLANSAASMVGVKGMAKLAIIPVAAGIASVASSRLWSSFADGNMDALPEDTKDLVTDAMTKSGEALETLEANADSDQTLEREEETVTPGV